tara:strand:- start:156 stop:1073 length:918 start_codon:yes stop_codon:yes gene_type:complete
MVRRGKTSFFKMGARVPQGGMTANKINLNFKGTAMVVHVDDRAIAKTVENWEQSEMLYKMAMGQGAHKALLKTKNYIVSHQAVVGSPYHKMARDVADSLDVKPALGGKKYTLTSGGTKEGIKSKTGFFKASALQTGTGKEFGVGSKFSTQVVPWAKYFKTKGRGGKTAKGHKQGSAVPLPPGSKGDDITAFLHIYEESKLSETQGGYAVIPGLNYLDYFGLEVAEEAGYRVRAMTRAIAEGTMGSVKAAYKHYLREESLFRHEFKKQALKMGLDDKQRTMSSYVRSQRPKTADMSFKESLKARWK